MPSAETKATHTPGPWLKAAIHTHCFDKNDMLVVDLSGPPEFYAINFQWRDEQGRRCSRCIATVHETARHEGEAKFNAQIIHAAPDMLAALEKLDAFWTEDCPQGPSDESKPPDPRYTPDEVLALWRQARAAIAKAKGEA